MCNQLVCTESGRRGGGFTPATPSFATHNGYQPWACPPSPGNEREGREAVFLCGNEPAQRPHVRFPGALNETAALWLANTADVHVHRETKRRPINLYQEEKPHLLSLPANPYDTAQVLCRTVNSEGHVAYRQNFSS